MVPSIFGENLFDEFWNDPFDMDRMLPRGRDPLYGKHSKNLMKTDVRETEGSYELDVPPFVLRTGSQLPAGLAYPSCNNIVFCSLGTFFPSLPQEQLQYSTGFSSVNRRVLKFTKEAKSVHSLIKNTGARTDADACNCFFRQIIWHETSASGARILAYSASRSCIGRSAAGSCPGTPKTG